MDNKNHYMIGPRAMNDYTANLPENDPRKKQKPWWENERKVASVVVASPMESKVRPENF